LSSIEIAKRPLLTTTYSSTWNSISQRYDRNGGVSPFYYFEAIQVNISIPDNYTFVSSSSINTYGYFYNGTFNPYQPTVNLVQHNDDSGGSGQFLINLSLVNTGSYVLVATTSSQNVQGAFSIIGSCTTGTVTFSKLNITVTTTSTSTTTTTTTTSEYRE
jgi:hypothetical protein